MSRLRRIAMSKYGRGILQVERAAISGVVGADTFLGKLSARRAGNANTHEVADCALTIVTKTFERPEIARRFVHHAREVFGGRVVVVDDSRQPMSSDDFARPTLLGRTATKLPGRPPGSSTAPGATDVVALPFNSGVSAGRIAGLDAVATPYVLMADDDHILTHSVNLDEVIDYLERNHVVDAVAFTVVEVPRLYTIEFGPESNALFPGHQPLKIPYGTEIDGLAVRAKTAQCYVARTDVLRGVGWDPNLRMLDHSDFFSRAAGRMVFVQHPTMRVLHGRTPWRRAFSSGRNNIDGDRAIIGQRWSGLSA